MSTRCLNVADLRRKCQQVSEHVAQFGESCDDLVTNVTLVTRDQMRSSRRSTVLPFRCDEWFGDADELNPDFGLTGAAHMRFCDPLKTRSQILMVLG